MRVIWTCECGRQDFQRSKPHPASWKDEMGGGFVFMLTSIVVRWCLSIQMTPKPNTACYGNALRCLLFSYVPVCCLFNHVSLSAIPAHIYMTVQFQYQYMHLKYEKRLRFVYLFFCSVLPLKGLLGLLETFPSCLTLKKLPTNSWI